MSLHRNLPQCPIKSPPCTHLPRLSRAQPYAAHHHPFASHSSPVLMSPSAYAIQSPWSIPTEASFQFDILAMAPPIPPVEPQLQVGYRQTLYMLASESECRTPPMEVPARTEVPRHSPSGRWAKALVCTMCVSEMQATSLGERG